MSLTGTGCPACDYVGRVPFDPAYPVDVRPCRVCSPWTDAPGFPDTALRAQAQAILDEPSLAWADMVAWAHRLLAYAAEKGNAVTLRGPA